MVSIRVKRGLSSVDTSILRDYVVIGGGFAGLNAMAGIQRGSPDKTILCASISTPGGSWTQYYDYARLHAPHPHFGVSGVPWKFKDPSILAPQKDVVEHFNNYVDQMPANFEFASETEFMSHTQNNDGTHTVTLKDLPTGDQMELHAKNVIDARGFNYHGHTRREADPLYAGSDIPEIQVQEVTQSLAAAQQDRLYVVIGGGKTGLDTVMHIAANKRPGDEILLVTGNSKQFMCRDKVFPPKETMSEDKFAPFTLGEIFLELAVQWDGRNGVDILKRGQESGYWHALEDVKAMSTVLGLLGMDERKIVEDNCSILQNDYFQSCNIVAETVVTTTTTTGGGATKTTTTTASHKKTRVNFRHAAPLETEKEVVLVNCRNSMYPEHNAFFSQVHPLTKGGMLNFGAMGGFTGPSNYLMALIHTKHPEALAKMKLYGHKYYVDMPKSKPTANWAVSFFTNTLANTISIAEVLGMEEMQAFTGDFNQWYPPAQQMSIFEKLMAAAPKIFEVAEAHSRRLVPGDEQPKHVLYT